MKIVKSILVKTQVVAFTGLIATLMLSVAPASAQSKILQSERSSCTAKLIGKTPGTRINLRSGPGTNYQRQGYGLVGDLVEVLPDPDSDSQDFLKALDNQGSLWYGISFPKSGAEGWVRQDFISTIKCSN